MSHSHRRSFWFSPHSDHDSGTVSHSCCSGLDIQPEPQGWPLPSPPGPRRCHSAARSGYSPESPSVWRRCLLRTHTKQKLQHFLSPFVGHLQEYNSLIFFCLFFENAVDVFRFTFSLKTVSKWQRSSKSWYLVSYNWSMSTLLAWRIMHLVPVKQMF